MFTTEGFQTELHTFMIQPSISEPSDYYNLLPMTGKTTFKTINLQTF